METTKPEQGRSEVGVRSEKAASSSIRRNPKLNPVSPTKPKLHLPRLEDRIERDKAKKERGEIDTGANAATDRRPQIWAKRRLIWRERERETLGLERAKKKFCY